LTETDDEALEPIEEPYLLITGLPCFLDSEGRRWTDALWQKDLVEHLRYIRKLTLASPLRRTPPPSGAKCLSIDPRFAGVHYVDLPPSDSELSGLINWPRTFWVLWRAIGKARIVHAGVADWPIPTGWSATIAARLRRRPLLINIESAFWRVPRNASVVKRVRAWFWETVNRWCVRHATLPLFTHHEYARQMLRDPGRGHVLQASWIDEENILDEPSAARIWDEKQGNDRLLLLYAGRLIADKGVPKLLDAMKDLNTAVQVDFIGAGVLAEKIAEAARHGDRVRLLEPVPYGPEFFGLLKRYNAIIVPSLSDEQPRIVYDAYSQAVPVLGTRTPGIEACVIDGETGYLAPAGSVTGLRDLLQRADADRPALRRMGLQALSRAREYTHHEMHRRRWHLLKHLGQENIALQDDGI